jgi:hypothetical protein
VYTPPGKFVNKIPPGSLFDPGWLYGLYSRDVNVSRMPQTSFQMSGGTQLKFRLLAT